jgi:phosphoribosylanthranilate isomerase
MFVIMQSRARVRFKVCCISSVEEMRIAVRAGASAVGLVSRMPSGPGVIPDERIAEIARRVPPGWTASC